MQTCLYAQGQATYDLIEASRVIVLVTGKLPAIPTWHVSELSPLIRAFLSTLSAGCCCSAGCSLATKASMQYGTERIGGTLSPVGVHCPLCQPPLPPSSLRCQHNIPPHLQTATTERPPHGEDSLAFSLLSLSTLPLIPVLLVLFYYIIRLVHLTQVAFFFFFSLFVSTFPLMPVLAPVKQH